MTRNHRLAAIGVLGAFTISLAACSDDEPTPEVTATVDLADPSVPATTPEPTDPTEEPTPMEDPAETDKAFRIGQPADGGTFATLVIPDDMPYGDELVLDDEWLTGNGMPQVGEWGVAYSPNPSTSSDYKPTYMFTIDEVTEPLDGADYDAVYDALGAGNGMAQHGNPIQKITYRIREIGTNGGDPSTFDILAVLRGLTFTSDDSTFLVSDEPILGCAGARNPFLEHGWATGDTVQGCGYAITPITATEQSATFYGIQTQGKLADGVTDAFTIYQTDKFPGDTGAGHDDHGHEEVTEDPNG